MKTSPPLNGEPRPRTKIVPFNELKPGNRILVSYGTVTVTGVQFIGHRVRVELLEQSPITFHQDNWPMLVIPSTASR